MDTFTRLIDAATTAMCPFVPRVRTALAILLAALAILLAALAILLVAWVAVRVVRAAALGDGARAPIDERLHSPGPAATLAGVTRELVWLLALPALLGTLTRAPRRCTAAHAPAWRCP